MRENLDVMNPPTAAKMVLLARVVDKRFPVESHVTTVYKQRTDALSKQEKAQDTPRLVLRRLKQILTEAREDLRKALVWSIPSLKVRTGPTGKIITSLPMWHVRT